MKNRVSNNMVFVVGGPGSSGSSTIAVMLAEYYSLERVYGGSLFRKAVADLGYKTLDDFYQSPNKEKFFEIDRRLDDYLIEKARRGNVVIESKVFAAIATVKNIPCTIKIWLDAPLLTRVGRFVAKSEGLGVVKKLFLYIKTVFNLLRRKRMDGKRYLQLYGVDYSRQEKYNDIVLNTKGMNERETFDLILEKIKDGGYIK